jgi:hypothetical protein
MKDYDEYYCLKTVYWFIDCLVDDNVYASNAVDYEFKENLLYYAKCEANNRVKILHPKSQYFYISKYELEEYFSEAPPIMI